MLQFKRIDEIWKMYYKLTDFNWLTKRLERMKYTFFQIFLSFFLKLYHKYIFKIFNLLHTISTCQKILSYFESYKFLPTEKHVSTCKYKYVLTLYSYLHCNILLHFLPINFEFMTFGLTSCDGNALVKVIQISNC